MGTMSLGHFKASENGGIALAQIARYYLGDYGIILLSLIIIVACLKTAIGLITAFSETFTELFPKQNYLMFATVVSIISCIFANVGLTKIIEYSTPVLMFLYPLAITIILLTLFSSFFNHSKIIYQFTTYFTMIASFVDGIKASPEFIANTGFAHAVINFGENSYHSSRLEWVGYYRPLSDLSSASSYINLRNHHTKQHNSDKSKLPRLCINPRMWE